MEFCTEKCDMQILESGKWQKMEGIELSDQTWIRTRGVKETHMYLGILEVDTIKHVEMKEKITKNNLDELENFSKQSSSAGISSKGKTSWLSSR